MAETPNSALAARMEELFCDLPPRTQDRIWRILLDHGVPPGLEKPKGLEAEWSSHLLTHRASVVLEARSDGSRFWRLYIESGSRYSDSLERRRIYIGNEGGPQLREAIRLLRDAYFGPLGEEFGLGPCKTNPELLRRLKARIAWERVHVYDEDGNYAPDALARRLGYGDQDE